MIPGFVPLLPSESCFLFSHVVITGVLSLPSGAVKALNNKATVEIHSAPCLQGLHSGKSSLDIKFPSETAKT